MSGTKWEGGAYAGGLSRAGRDLFAGQKNLDGGIALDSVPTNAL